MFIKKPDYWSETHTDCPDSKGRKLMSSTSGPVVGSTVDIKDACPWLNHNVLPLYSKVCTLKHLTGMNWLRTDWLAPVSLILWGFRGHLDSTTILLFRCGRILKSLASSHPKPDSPLNYLLKLFSCIAGPKTHSTRLEHEETFCQNSWHKRSHKTETYRGRHPFPQGCIMHCRPRLQSKYRQWHPERQYWRHFVWGVTSLQGESPGVCSPWSTTVVYCWSVASLNSTHRALCIGERWPPFYAWG